MRIGSLLLMLVLVVSCNSAFHESSEFHAISQEQSSSAPGVDGMVNVDDGSSGGSSTGGSSSGSSSGSSGGSTSGSQSGSTPVAAMENFTQKASTSQLDILWVVDNSGSMSDEQDALGRNFDLFIRDFIMKGVDFKMAITTTDVKGYMVSGSDKLTSAYAAADPQGFHDYFIKKVKVGTDGPGKEQGLGSSYNFFEQFKSSFLRPDAYLAVVIISDEEDQSSKTTDEYAAYLKGLKKNGGYVKVYSIVDVNKINKGNNVVVGGERYAKVSKATAGTVADIYKDFAVILEGLGGNIIGLLDSFSLANDPVAGTLKVYVNDQLSSDYVFDSKSRTIKFNNAPAVGAKISVSYTYLK